MNNYWQELLKYLSSITIITGIIGYFAKLIIDSILNKSLKKYEIDITSLAKRDEIKFSKLHEDRAFITKELYKKIYILEKKLMPYMDIVKDDMANYFNDEYHNEVIKSVNDFVEYANENLIYYDKNTCMLINEIEEVLKYLNLDGFVWQTTGLGLRDNDFDEVWANKAYDLVITKIPRLKKELEIIFREILGVE